MSGFSYGFGRRVGHPVAKAAAPVFCRCWKGLLAAVVVSAVLALVYVYNLDYRPRQEGAVQDPAVDQQSASPFKSRLAKRFRLPQESIPWLTGSELPRR